MVLSTFTTSPTSAAAPPPSPVPMLLPPPPAHATVPSVMPPRPSQAFIKPVRERKKRVPKRTAPTKPPSPPLLLLPPPLSELPPIPAPSPDNALGWELAAGEIPKPKRGRPKNPNPIDLGNPNPIRLGPPPAPETLTPLLVSSPTALPSPPPLSLHHSSSAVSGGSPPSSRIQTYLPPSVGDMNLDFSAWHISEDEEAEVVVPYTPPDLSLDSRLQFGMVGKLWAPFPVKKGLLLSVLTSAWGRSATGLVVKEQEPGTYALYFASAEARG